MTKFPILEPIKTHAYVDEGAYKTMYKASITNPEDFWRKEGHRIDWMKPYTKVKNVQYGKNTSIKWYEDGTLNASYNCIDRHLPHHAEKTALIWEGDKPNETLSITYHQLYEDVCRFANVLKNRGIKKGDRVTIYMPMIPETIYAMLACARIGAIHSVVFAGFSADALAQRIIDCQSQCVITTDEGIRGGKIIPLKNNTDMALKQCPDVSTVLVVQRTYAKLTMISPRDIYYKEACKDVEAVCEPEEMNAEDPLFILYTSGSTGKPKGVVHTTGGYMVYVSLTHHYVFDYHPQDIYWCAADVGWITGHSYIVYGPLANAATVLIYEGIPQYPDSSRFWEMCDRHRVTIFYTAPTVIRSLMAEGTAAIKKAKLHSLRLLGSVGEPINPEAWLWYHREIGKNKCPIMDTWWQTETGGILITPLPGATSLKPGSATLPFFGIKPVLVNDKGVILDGEAKGNLCIADSWPSQMRTVYGDHQRFIDTYFSHYDGLYFTGDGCYRDAEGYYWITGRVDDVINVSGHRMGTAEVESALVAHAHIAEAAVVGYPHAIKGEGIYCYVTPNVGVIANDELKNQLIQSVRKQIGPIATPDVIHFTPHLPKTRSGKIMRRILRKIAAGETTQFGDVSTLADPSVITDMIEQRKNK